jgi:hypothetical protein
MTKIKKILDNSSYSRNTVAELIIIMPSIHNTIFKK